MVKKKALIISYSNLHSDPRVLRQIEFLNEDFIIYTAGLSPSNHFSEADYQIISDHTIQFHKSYPSLVRKLITLFLVLPIQYVNSFKNFLTLGITKNFEKLYWTHHRKLTLKTLLRFDVDLVVANDIDALPLAIKLKSLKGCKVYFDAHEYAPLEYENDPRWLKRISPYIFYLCQKYIPIADYCTTVGHNIAEEYEKLTGTHFDVVYNSPQYQELPVSEVNGDLIRCVHHGVASPIRNIESMIHAFILLGSRFQLNLFLMVNDKKYFSDLTELAAGHSNIIFHEPVATKNISKFINQYDISLIFIPPINFNYKNCLPNKFFESVQARLMLLCGTNPEMKLLVEKYGLGEIAEGFTADDIEKSLRNIKVESILEHKNNSNNFAETLSAKTSMSLLVEGIRRLWR